MRPFTPRTRTLGWLLPAVVALSAVQLVLVGRASAEPDPRPEPVIVEEPLSFVVDESLESVGAGKDDVATIANSLGNRSDFASDELIVITNDEAALERLLERRGGKILHSFDPAEHGYEELRRRYLVGIDASEVKTDRLASDLEALGAEARGEHRLSSRQALGLVAVAAGEAVEGMTVDLNWLAQGHTIRTRTTTEGSGLITDAFRWAHFANGTVQDTGIGEAWNLLVRADRLPPVGTGPRIGILDRGFASFDPDIPGGSVQLSTGPNPSPCSSGNPCRFHGANVTSTALALVDNRFGAAGAAGPVARALQLDSRGTMFGAANGMVVLQSLGARIINMSFGGTEPHGIGNHVDWFDRNADAVRARGTILVASAGNAGIDVDQNGCFISCWESEYHWPCETTGVLCVGGLGLNSKSPQSDPLTGSSNYAFGPNRVAGTIDIWAPWFAAAGVDPSDPFFATNSNRLTSFAGTSASAPVVSGVAALVWAAKPTLTAAQVESTILSTAQPGSGGAALTIDAEAAVTSALGPNLPPDIRIAQPSAGSWVPRGWVRFRADASDREDGVPRVRWFADDTTFLGEGNDILLPTHSVGFGFRKITAVAIDSGGRTVPDADGGVVINLANTRPVVAISKPTSGSVFYVYRNRLQGGWSGDTIELRGLSFDLNNSPIDLPDQQVWWIRGDEAPIRGHVASVNALDLGIGTHTITFWGTDGQYPGSKSVTIEVREWLPTVCSPGLSCS